MNESILQVKNLNKTYGKFHAVTDLSFEIIPGELFGFLGPNGAGKTTSINMICGLLKPDSGQVFFQGKSLINGDRHNLKKIGMCPQNITLWERLTCLEQLELIGELYDVPAAEAHRRALRLLDELGLSEKSRSLAHALSGGMQRRLNLALALVHEPEIVVLDEPEAGLDPQSRIRVRDFIRSLARRKTVILTTHDMDEADRLVDRLAIIDHGQLLVLDTPQALKQRLGQGDVIELTLLDPPFNAAGLVQQALENLVQQCSWNAESGVLALRALNGLAHLPEILTCLENCGLKNADIRLRANTLEDVFIQLTGRSLRP
ncbi:MAG: ABC transporter ATP-binding protein [Anaerolineae bacterium]|nr:ABC transporter ATP-binding protein [Anaerolineae bacterium]